MFSKNEICYINSYYLLIIIIVVCDSINRILQGETTRLIWPDFVFVKIKLILLKWSKCFFPGSNMGQAFSEMCSSKIILSFILKYVVTLNYW